jgi:acyl carrier protein
MKTEAFVAILEGILQAPKGSLRMEDGPKTVKTWDSMAGVTILATIDQELHVELSDELVSKFTTVGQMIEVLKSQGFLQD